MRATAVITHAFRVPLLPTAAAGCVALTAFAAPTPASAQEARMFTWHDAGQAGLTDTLMLNAHRRPQHIVSMARDAWADADPDERVLILAPWEMYAAAPFEASLPHVVKHGLDFGDMKSWWTDTITALDDAGLAPSRVAIDFEKGVNYWNLEITDFDKGRQSHFQPVWDDPAAYAALPDELKQYTADDIHWRDQAPVQAWNQFASDILVEALTDAFVEPLRAVSPDTSIGNYGDARYAWGHQDERGWTILDEMIGDTANPVLYSTDAGTNLATLLAVVAAYDDPTDVVPWIGAPRLMGWEAFEQTVEGAYALGVRDFLLFNPGSDENSTYAGDNAFAAQVLADLNAGQSAQALSRLPEPATAAALLGLAVLVQRRRR